MTLAACLRSPHHGMRSLVEAESCRPPSSPCAPSFMIMMPSKNTRCLTHLLVALLLVSTGDRVRAQTTTTSAPATSAPVTAATTTSSSPAASPAVTTQSPASSATTSGWGGCVNLKDKNSNGPIKIGQPTVVCLQVGNSVNWAAGVSYIRLSFTPETDQYSRFYVPNSYANLVSNNTDTIWMNKNITVGAASLQTLSFLKMYYNIQAKKIYPFLTAIINVHKGVITSITWDDACVFCSPSECEQITYDFNGVLQSSESSGQPTGGCYVPQADCQPESASSGTGGNSPGGNLCDIVLYVVWSGTDASNRAFQSANSRFSAFPPQNIQDRIKQLLPEIPSLGGRRDLSETTPATTIQSDRFRDGEAIMEVAPGGVVGRALVPEF